MLSGSRRLTVMIVTKIETRTDVLWMVWVGITIGQEMRKAQMNQNG